MSFNRGGQSNDFYFDKISFQFTKNNSHRSLVSPKNKTRKEIISEAEILTNKKASPLKDNLVYKPEFLSSRPQKLTSRAPLIEDKVDLNLKLNLDRVRSLSGNFPKPSPRTTSKFLIRSPLSNDIQSKFNVNIGQSQDFTTKKFSNTSSFPVDPLSARSPRGQNSQTLPNLEPTQYSKQQNGPIYAFSACTNQGLVRNYNEDRILLCLNVPKPVDKEYHEDWPNCNIFGVMDGHGGSKCADFFKENFHHYILRSKFFPWNPHEALKEACAAVDKDFLEKALTGGAKDFEDKKHDKSGSCALILMTIGEHCYICNVGDSRAVMSQNKGEVRFALTRDHKPNDKMEHKRITEAGGTIYQNFPMGPNGKRIDIDPAFKQFNLNSVPFRISPGRLSPKVSRAFGDLEAKMTKFGGNPNVLISKPEVTTLKINQEYDFIVLGCDGIFDVLSNEEVIGIVWNTINSRKGKNIHETIKLASEDIIKEALMKRSLDNVTAIVICFSNFGYKTQLYESINGKTMLQNSIKMSQRWEYYQSENESGRPLASREKSQSFPIKNPLVLSPRTELMPEKSNIKSMSPKRGLELIKTLPFDKLNLQGLGDHQKKNSNAFPKISAIRTPR